MCEALQGSQSLRGKIIRCALPQPRRLHLVGETGRHHPVQDEGFPGEPAGCQDCGAAHATGTYHSWSAKRSIKTWQTELARMMSKAVSMGITDRVSGPLETGSSFANSIKRRRFCWMYSRRVTRSVRGGGLRKSCR